MASPPAILAFFFCSDKVDHIGRTFNNLPNMVIEGHFNEDIAGKDFFVGGLTLALFIDFVAQSLGDGDFSNAISHIHRDRPLH